MAEWRIDNSMKGVAVKKSGADRAAIEEAVRPATDALGLDLEAVEITAAGQRSVLRVAVDQDGGVTLDDIAATTRAVDDALETAGVMGERAYTLEVTSRGVDRPLTAPRHWRRNEDRLVKVTLTEGEKLTGRISSSTDEAVALVVDGTEREVALKDIDKALVQVEFNRREES